MAQIQKGDTFADGQLVTAARLNALLDSAILNPNAITDQALITTGNLSDTLLVYQASTSALKKITFDDLIGISTGGGLGVLTATQVFGNTGLSISTGAGNVTIAGYNNTDIGNASSASGNTNIYSYNDVNIGCSIGNVVVTSPIVFSGSTIAGNATLNGNILIGAGKTLTLDSAPTLALHAATKAYVDSTTEIKSFCKFNGSGGIMSSRNVTTVSRVSLGTYNVTFTTAMANADYVITASCTNNAGLSGWVTIYNQTSSGFQILTAYPVSFGGAQLPYDPTAVFFTVVSN